MRPAVVHHGAPSLALDAQAVPWVGRIVAGGAAFAAGIGLTRAGHPLVLGLLPVVGTLAIAAAVTWPRWCLVAALFLLVAYVPDVLITHSAAHAVTAVVLTGAVLRRALAIERLAVPGEMVAFGALALAYIAAALFATDRAAAAAETLDLVSYAAVVALLVTLLDSPSWLRRAVWAIVLGVGLLAVLAIVQQVTHSYAASYGGFASILPAGNANRSAGPLNPNPFGQVLAASAVLAVYLAAVERRLASRALAVALAVACVAGVTYTQSRAALIALLIVALAAGVLRGIRLRVLAVAACGVIVLGSLVLPASLQTRVGALYAAVSSNAGTPQDPSLRGRESENLAGAADVGRPSPGRGRTRTTSRCTTRSTPKRSGPIPGPSSAARTTSTSSRSPRPVSSGRWPSSACCGLRSQAPGGRAAACEAMTRCSPRGSSSRSAPSSSAP